MTDHFSDLIASISKGGRPATTGMLFTSEQAAQIALIVGLSSEFYQYGVRPRIKRYQGI